MSGLRRCTSCDVVMGASATACPICATPTAAGDVVIDLTGTAADEPSAADPRSTDPPTTRMVEAGRSPTTGTAPAPSDEPSPPHEQDLVHANGSEARRREHGGRVGAVPDTSTGRTRPKTPLRPYVPPSDTASPAARSSSRDSTTTDEAPSVPTGRDATTGAEPTPATPPPPPPSAPEQADLPPTLLGAATAPSAPAQPSPWTAPPGAAVPGPAPTHGADGAAAEPPDDAEAPSGRRARRAARVLLALLVVMVAIGLWLQWDRIADAFEATGDETSLVADTAGGPAQAPVVDGRFERSVGSLVTHTILDSTTT